MSNQISWHVELAVEPSRFDRFQDLTAEMVESTRNEAGVLCFERYVSDDRRVVHIYERYVDSAAAVEHLQRFRQKFAERFAAMVERKQFSVFGSPSQELKEHLDRYGATYFDPLDGFSRH